jgi:hypothetical protein
MSDSREHSWLCATRRTTGGPLCDCGAIPFPVLARRYDCTMDRELLRGIVFGWETDDAPEDADA